MSEKIRLGYVMISNQVICEKKSVGYFYREQPEAEDDSGWIFFSGEESQEYADNADNFAFYNASTILKICPEIVSYLVCEAPIAFELLDGEFKKIED